MRMIVADVSLIENCDNLSQSRVLTGFIRRWDVSHRQRLVTARVIHVKSKHMLR